MVTFLQNTQDLGDIDDTVIPGAVIISVYLLRPMLINNHLFSVNLSKTTNENIRNSGSLSRENILLSIFCYMKPNFC